MPKASLKLRSVPRPRLASIASDRVCTSLTAATGASALAAVTQVTPLSTSTTGGIASPPASPVSASATGSLLCGSRFKKGSFSPSLLSKAVPSFT